MVSNCFMERGDNPPFLLEGGGADEKIRWNKR